MRVGFVGAGRMGLPMVKRLVEAGNEVRVFVRSDAGRTAVREAGADAVSVLTDVAHEADGVVVCVHTDEQAREICLENGLLDVMRTGSVLIVHTTGSPLTVRDIAAAAEGVGVEVVDAPVSGGPNDIAAGSITVFVGGGRVAFDGASRILVSYADPIRYVGPVGSGQLMKLVNNSIFLANIEIIAAATQFGAELGIDQAMMIECLGRGSANSYALGGVAAAGGPKAFKASVSEFLAKDIEVVRAVASATGADLGPIGVLLAGGIQ